MFRNSKYFIIAMCIAASAGAVAQAHGNDPYPREYVSTTVRINDLDLTTPEGRHTLDRRLRLATGAICISNGVRDLDLMRDEARCRREAKASVGMQVASAVAAAGRPDAAAIAAR